MTSPFLTSREAVCPPNLLKRAQELPSPRVAIARAGSALPMLAAKEAFEANIMQPVFIGERADIEAEAEKLSWDISAFPLHETTGEQEAGTVAANLCGAGEADVLMKGQLHSDTFMRAAVSRDAGLRTGARFVHIFHLTHPDSEQPLLISDAAVNVAPDEKTLQSAMTSVRDLLQTLGVSRPKIAMLSATESVLDAVPSSGQARAMAEWAAENLEGADVAGPLALDLILSPEAVATKGLSDNPVAGRADAIVVPDIVSGNALFKSLVYVGGACAAGIVMGAKVPVLLTSRADPAAARMASVALASIVSNG